MNDHERRRFWQLRSRTVLTVALGAVLALGLLAKPLSIRYALLFRVHDPVPSDVLVILTGGEHDRALHTAELYRQGFGRRILICTDSDTSTNRTNMVSAGVPADSITTLGAVSSTHDEAVRVRDYIRANPVQRLTIVTTAYHSARAYWVFRRVLQGTGVEVHVAATQDARFNESNWYRSEAGRTFYVRELFKTIYYRLVY